MNQHLSITSIGYSHIAAHKPCQDFSATYSDGERTIVTACDGHGGAIYVRSKIGSRLASFAVTRALLEVENLLFHQYSAEEIERALRLSVLCEWNRLVERHLKAHPLRRRELAGLTEKQVEDLKKNPIRAYGTTLGGAMLQGKRLVCVSLGDGGCFLLKRGEVIPAFPDDEDEPVANITYSMCGEDAFERMHARIFDAKSLDGVLLCTDGVLSPYGSMENFKRAFARPVLRRLLEDKAGEVKDFIRLLGREKGVGDDVSLSVLLKDTAKLKDYQA